MTKKKKTKLSLLEIRVKYNYYRIHLYMLYQVTHLNKKKNT